MRCLFNLSDWQLSLLFCMIQVLFVSPERFLNEEFMSIISSCPLISLVVIDEAHCVSEWYVGSLAFEFVLFYFREKVSLNLLRQTWYSNTNCLRSHNFRPSYMRLRASVLHDKLKAGCVLAMTATATQKALHAVMHALDIPSMNLVQTHHLRNNLQLSVSMSGNKKYALPLYLSTSADNIGFIGQELMLMCWISRVKDLIAIMKSSPYSELKSIIIYCKFQVICEVSRVSKIILGNSCKHALWTTRSILIVYKKSLKL